MNLLATFLDASVQVSIPLGSGVDFFVFVLIIVGSVIGYKRGVIVESINLLVVLLLLTVCITFSNECVFKPLRTTINMLEIDLFATLVMATLFVLGLVFVVSKINFKAQVFLQNMELGSMPRYLGALLGAFKYYIISAFFLVVMIKIDMHAKFLPTAAQRSVFTRYSIYLITRAYPRVLFETDEGSLLEYPKDRQENNSDNLN